MKKLFKIKSRKKFAENKVFKFFFDSIEDKENNISEDNYLVVETHNSLKDTTGVSILPVVDESVLLINIYRHAINKEILEVPRGFMEKTDPSIKFAALRELEEETNLSCDKKDLIFKHSIYPEPGILRAKIALFIANNCYPKEVNVTNSEFGHNSYRFFSKKEVFKLLKSPEKLDTTTYILLTHWYYDA